MVTQIQLQKSYSNWWKLENMLLSSRALCDRALEDEMVLIIYLTKRVNLTNHIVFTDTVVSLNTKLMRGNHLRIQKTTKYVNIVVAHCPII